MVRFLILLILLIHYVEAKKQPPLPSAEPVQKWETLSGNSPVVIARGGLSGLFPESSFLAYDKNFNGPDVVFFCDLQMTKDGSALCLRNILLDNATDVANIYPNRNKTLDVNGQSVTGWFSMDFTNKEIKDIRMMQSVLSRPSAFDTLSELYRVETIGKKVPHLWVNVQYPMVYKPHKVDVGAYIPKLASVQSLSYVSSPDVGFLKSLNGKVRASQIKLILTFLDAKEIEPTTKKSYGQLLADLVSIKSFASGILVPKNYIWPVKADLYLEPHTTLVADAHKQGLEVFASGFANDMPASYNYSYDPATEILNFVDNSEFSVDGLVTDFPPTASQTLACLAHNKNAKPVGNFLIISKTGASGVYPSSSDLAYQQAVEDGADIIDCSVQMSQDGIPFCSESENLMAGTNAIETFIDRTTTIPEIQQENGIFSFDLSWSEIQTLKPTFRVAKYNPLIRNPANKNKGKIVSLDEFLEIAKGKAAGGILIRIQNAAYLASKRGLGIIDAIDSSLKNATFDKRVLISSDDTSVLSKYASVPSYERVLDLIDLKYEVTNQSIDVIKKFADAVILYRESIVTEVAGFTDYYSTVVDNMHAANISVYVSTLRNDYRDIAFDFLSDPYVEINTFVNYLGVDGVITDYPATSSAYKRSPCHLTEDGFYVVDEGSILALIPPVAMPPAEAPLPELQPADIVDPPLPPVTKLASSPPTADGHVPTSNNTTNTDAKAPGAKSSQPTNVANLGLSLITMILVVVMLRGY